VQLPAAAPPKELALAAAAVPLVSQAKVYLLRVVVGVPPPDCEHPIAKIPTVPTLPPLTPNPKPVAEIAPLVEIIGIYNSHLN
jgi:hypothetical protein